MTKFCVKISRFAATVILLLVFLPGLAIVNAAVGEINNPIRYKSRFVPPLSVPKYPEGFSGIRADVYLFHLNRLEWSWVIDIPFDNQYVSLTLFAGGHNLYHPFIMSRDSYLKYSVEKADDEAWIKDMANFSGTKGKDKGEEGIDIPLNINIPKPVKSIIGEGGPRINVTGSRRISFSGKSQWDDLTTTGTFKQSKFPSLHMEQTSRFKIKGQIGSKISVEVDQDSNRDVDMANTLKLRYKGEEDEIIQSIEAGNTTLSLPNSQFIGFSQNVQGLFGIKATAKIGNINLTMITSQEKGSSEKSSFSAGTQASDKKIWDYQYLHNVYFFLGYEFTEADSLLDVQLFREGLPRDLYGLACVDPHYGSGANETGGVDTMFYNSDEDSIRGEIERRNFILIEETEYDLFPRGKYIILHQAVSESGVLAAYIKYNHTDSLGNVSIRQEGKVTGDTLVLKLIRDPDVDTSFTTWDLEWRNVYDLGSQNLTREGFELQIYKGNGSLETDVLDQDSIPFIQWFGFDEYENANPDNPTPDGLFDFNTRDYLDAARGHLIFRQREPFAESFLTDPNRTIYDYRYSNSTPAQSKKYYIYIKTAKRDNTFSLRKTNIIEGSEVVKMSDGRVLKRGTDYNIVYEIGQITFINEEALNAAADISVDFEYAPFFMPEKKSFYGLSAQYDINDKSFFSISGLYRKESSKEFRPRVGREPKRAMIWDSNIKLSFDPKFITSAVDALPLIETDAVSRIEISGEVAQSFPNPNLRNRAYIDDFEGTREYTDLITRRGVWTKASAPAGWELDSRRECWWYNPYDSYTIKDIWPDKDVQQYENRQDVLVLEYWPDTTSGGPDMEGWAGIMRSMYAGLSDQSRTKFIEIWYLPDNFASSHPILHIDAGKISEDLDGDGDKDTEDKNDDGVFQEEEDTGLDGWYNDVEIEMTGLPGPDPSGDDWFYDDDIDLRYDYTRINGTENSREDPDRLNRIDTEDINNNGSLDLTNAYFEYAVDLNDDNYVQEITDSGWRLLRIPFQDSSAFTTVGNPDFEVINFIRLSLSGITGHYTLRLASIQLVGNKWQALAPPDPIYMNGIPLVPDFEVNVKNTQEHANSYESPPGIYGELDQETGVQEKEQSLVLIYNNLYPGQSLGTYWTLLDPDDYTLYNKMKMYVHGDENLGESIPLNFYFRVGADSLNNYYEFRTKLFPGWDERNYVDIDFTELTALKSYLHANHPDSINLVDTTNGQYSIKGNPSLSQVKFFVLGIEYDSIYCDTISSGDSAIVDTVNVPLAPISGEVWCDELILTDVRRNSDFAGRMTATIGLADLGDITFNYSKTGADFFRLNQTKPEGSLSTQQSVSSRISLDKFLPPSLGLSLPLSARWETTLRLPRLKTGSDIILPDDLRQNEKTETRNWSVSTSESFRRNTKNWLFNLTLNRITSSYTYAKKYSTSPVTPVNNSTSYDITGKYDLTPKTKPFFKPFFWTKKIFMPASIHDIKLFFLPTVLKYDAAVKSTNSYQLNNRGIVSSTYARDFTGSQSYGMDLFTALKADFSTTTRRDISKPGSLVFSLNPGEIQLGRERDYSQHFSTSFTPKISRDLLPRVQFSSSYTDNSDLAGNPDSTRTTQLSANLRGDLTLDVFKLTGIGKLISSQQAPNNNVPNKPKKDEIPIDKDGEPKINDGDGEPAGEGDPEKEQGEEVAEEETGEADETGGGLKIPNPLTGLKKVFSVLNTVKPLKTSFSTDKKINRAGLYDRPGWDYTLGFVDKTSVRRNIQEGFNTSDQITHTLDYSFTSGFTPLKNLDINSSYKNRISVARGSNTPTETKSVEFPSLDANLTGLEKLPLINRLTTSVTIQTKYAQKIDESGNADSGELTSRATKQNFTPLLGFNFSFNKGVKATIRYDYNKGKSENLRTEGSNQRVDYSQDNSLGISVSYSLTAPQGLKIPILGKFKFDSQLTMSLDYDKKYRKSWFVTNEVVSTDANSVETSIEPKVSYRFSAKVTGGFNAKWMDSNDKVQGRQRHVRELGIWTELRF